MKKIDSCYFGIGMNDYEVKVITNDNLDIRRVIAKEDIKEDDYNVKANEEIKLTDEDKKFFEEGLKEEFSAVNIGGIYCELPVNLPVEEMNKAEKIERLSDINKLLKSLVAEKKEILSSIETEKPKENTSCKNTKLDDMSVDELKQYAKNNDMRLTSKVKGKMIIQIKEYEKARSTKGNVFREESKNSKSIDELIKEALNSKKTASEVVDNAIKGLKKNDIINILKESGFSFSKSKSKEELIKDIKVTVARKVGFEKIRSNNQKER